MYALVGNGPSNHHHQTSLLDSWWHHPPAGGAVGHGCDREGKYILEVNKEKVNNNVECQGLGPKGGNNMDSQNQQYCLKWNSFGSNLATSFSNLYKSDSLTDVTLFCEGVTFKAHRLILAACSKHFQELFEGMPPSPAGLIVILDGTSASNMTALMEFMYRGEVHVSQDSLTSFLKAAESLEVKGLSMQHEKLAFLSRCAEANNSSTEPSSSSNGPIMANSERDRDSSSSERNTLGGRNSAGSGSGLNGGGCASNAGSNVAESAEAPENGLARGIKRRTPTPAPPSPAPTYSLPSVYSATHYYDSPQKRIMRSPSEVDILNRASVLRDGAAFRPASAPHQLLLEYPLHAPFSHPLETPTHPHTAPHTPTELERELERERSEERSNSEIKQSVAEDLRVKQEPVTLTDRDRAEKLNDMYTSSGHSFEGGTYANNTDHLRHGDQMGSGLPPAHPPTPDLSPVPTTPAMWNSKINKAGTVTTPDGKKLKCPFCERLYGYETNLRAHIRQRHQGIRVPCPFCTRTFTRNNTVRRHIQREHKQEYEFKTSLAQSNNAVADTVQQ